MATFTYMIIEDSLVVCKGIKGRMDDYPEWKCRGLLHHVARAIEKIKTCKPDLIFIDWSLKGGSAYEVLSSVCNLPGYAPYIIFNTGYQSENPEIPQEIINNYKIDKYLVKPLWENLRWHLAEYLEEAKNKTGKPGQRIEETWLKDISRKNYHIKVSSIVCILQHFENPYHKTMVLDNDLQITLPSSWGTIIELLNSHEVNFFVTNSREHIVIKEHIEYYNRPYVKVFHLNQRIEVVKNKLSAFERWLAEPLSFPQPPGNRPHA